MQTVNKLMSISRKGLLNSDKGFIKRWPTCPKVAFFGPPNVFQDEIIRR